jgi:hypothetical protein
MTLVATMFYSLFYEQTVANHLNNLTQLSQVNRFKIWSYFNVIVPFQIIFFWILFEVLLI